VEAVRGAPVGEQETNYLEWKGSLDLASKAARAAIAKAVLGFSNRRPDVTGKACEGCAYLLVGVEPGVLAGVEIVDAAKLESGLLSYIGSEVQWRADYVDVDDRAVLVVSVEPPKWGDPIHPVRKSFLGNADETILAAGTVFVRHQASTDPATPSDIDDLSRRAAHRTDNDLAIDVLLLNDAPLLRVDLSEDAVAVAASRRRTDLMRPISSRPPHPAGVLIAFARAVGEYRSAETYTNEVDKYIGKLTDALPDALLARSVLHNTSPLRLGITNNTERTFTGVRVEITVPEGIEVCAYTNDLDDRPSLPRPPLLYGEVSVGAHWSYRDVLIKPPVLRPIWAPDAYRDGETTTIMYADAEVRAEDTYELPEIWLLLDQDAPSELLITWEATAKEANKRLHATITVPIAEEFADTERLLADPPEQD
jgi:hypothetical protein